MSHPEPYFTYDEMVEMLDAVRSGVVESTGGRTLTLDFPVFERIFEKRLVGELRDLFTEIRRDLVPTGIRFDVEQKIRDRIRAMEGIQ